MAAEIHRRLRRGDGVLPTWKALVIAFGDRSGGRDPARKLQRRAPSSIQLFVLIAALLCACAPRGSRFSRVHVGGNWPLSCACEST